METLNEQEFANKYGTEAVASFGVRPQDSGYFERVATSIKGDLEKRINRFGQISGRQDTGAIEKKVQQFGQGAGLAANVAETVIGELPGVKQAIGKVGEGINWLATDEFSPIKHLGDVIGSNKTLQEVTRLYDTDTNFRDTVDAVANTVRLGGDVQGIVDSANFTKNVTNKVIRNLKQGGEAVAGKVATGLAETTVATSPAIMSRVARLNPTKARKFEQLAGKSHGQYLADTGNFGTPDTIIKNEATKFINSKNAVDETFASLPGEYRVDVLRSALNELLEKAKSTSVKGAPSPYLQQVEQWLAKYKDTGLNMSEINEVKRLYERKVKLGYNKLLNADKIERATNLDNTLRQWQFKKAKELGFENVDELNKQTQISRFLINELGDDLIGKSGLNSVSLTDWIILAGGDPTAVATFLTKKFFSSKAIQAKIAELLKQGDIEPPITPRTTQGQQQ